MIIKVRENIYNELIADVMLNGHFMGTLMVDTGSSDIMLNEKFIKLLNLGEPISVDSVDTGNGRLACKTYHLDSIECSGHIKANQRVIWNDYAEGDGFDGILGRAFFAGEDEITLKKV